MDYNFYLEAFQAAAATIDRKILNDTGIELFTGAVLESVALKAYKPQWSDDPKNPLTATSRIFFSVWVNDKTIEENKLYYNIHALKLREFKGYKMQSRDFAERFRSQFKSHKKDWPNVDTDYGPLTLMEGWVPLNDGTLQKDITTLVNKFLAIHTLIDKTLAHYKI